MLQTNIGGKIKYGRRNKGLSQNELAARLFVSKQAVGKWERGESLPDILMLGDIGKIIGTTDLNYFIGKEVKICSCKECECLQDGTE
jgi:transcriptional regulator with XRE-family HTH domain